MAQAHHSVARQASKVSLSTLPLEIQVKVWHHARRCICEEEVIRVIADSDNAEPMPNIVDVRLNYSKNIRAIPGLNSLFRREAESVIHRYAQLYLSEPEDCYGERNIAFLKDRIGKFRRVRVGLAMPSRAMGSIVDQIDMVSFFAVGYGWAPEGCVIWARAQASLFPMADEAVLQVIGADIGLEGATHRIQSNAKLYFKPPPLSSPSNTDPCCQRRGSSHLGHECQWTLLKPKYESSMGLEGLRVVPFS